MANVKMIAEEIIHSGECLLAKFKENLSKNPVYAFEWSADAFYGAAKMEVGIIIKQWCERGQPDNPKFIPTIREHALAEVTRVAKYPPRSTSVQSNLMEQEKARVWAEVLERVK